MCIVSISPIEASDSEGTHRNSHDSGVRVAGVAGCADG